MNDSVCVSVVCVTYNHEKYIKTALDGFVNQKTDFKYEVIIYDDASTDSTAKIIAEYEKAYPDIIKPIYQKVNTYGQPDRWYKYILPCVNGKYIALCEGDDYWIDENKLQKQYDFINSHSDCSAVVHKAKRYYEANGYFEEYYKFDFNDDKPHLLTTEFVFENNSSFPYNSLFFDRKFYDVNKDYFMKNIPFDYVIKILLATMGNIYLLPDCMSVYRKGTNGSWTNRISTDNQKYIEHFTKSLSYLRNADVHTGYRFSSLFEKEILSRKFRIEILKGNKKVIFDKKYKELYKSFPLKQRLSIVSGLYLPQFKAFLKKLKHKLLKRKR